LHESQGGKMKNDGVDLPFLVKEFDVFAEELSKLPSSVETTALELRFALLRQIVEAKYRRRTITEINLDPN
jgi:hypothetical protein